MFDFTKPNAFDASIVSISWWKGLAILGFDLVSVPRLYEHDCNQAPAELRQCVVCDEFKYLAGFGKKQWKYPTRRCMACASEEGGIAYHIWDEDDKQFLLSRCHSRMTAFLLMKHKKVTSYDARVFLEDEWETRCIHCDQGQAEFVGYADSNGDWWTASDWLVWHLEQAHDKWEKYQALAHMISEVASLRGWAPPLILEHDV